MPSSRVTVTKTERLRHKNKVLRIPRPTGITHTLSQYHKATDPSQKQEILSKVQNRIIAIWTLAGMILNNRVYTIDQLANYLNTTNTNVMLRMNKEMERLGNIYQDAEGMRLTRASFVGTLLKGLEIRALTESQVHLLMASQGAEYKPFISGEVNRALANLINAQKPLIDILKLTMEGPNGQSLLPTPQQSNTQNIYIGTDEAVKLINSRSLSILQDPDKLEAKMGHYSELPDVNARNQNLTSIGIRHDGTQQAEVIEPAKKLKHSERREQDGDIVGDAEEFMA